MNKKSLSYLLLSLVLGLAVLTTVYGSERIRKPRGPRPQAAQSVASAAPRGQSATILPDGRILLVGGEGPRGPLQNASVRDPQSGVTTVLSAKLQEARAFHSATLLPNGTVLIFGGAGQDGSVVSLAESFNPGTLTFQTLQPTGLTPRSHHTATLLTNGLVFIAGGETTDDATIGTAQLWDFRTSAVTNVSQTLILPRHDQTATLLADGTVLLWGGVLGNGLPAPAGEIFDPKSGSFRTETIRPVPTPDGDVPQLEESIPDDNSENIPVNSFIAVRFSKPMRVQTVNPMTITVADAGGNVSANIVPAAEGMLAFITPNSNLMAGTIYTVTLSGLVDQSGLTLPDTGFSFTTAGTSPDTGGVLGNTDSWPGGPQASPWAKLPPLQAAPGITALSGQVLLQDGHPLADVTFRIGTLRTKTDETGRFLFRDIPSGHSAMVIDGRTANTKKATYGVFEDGVDITASKTTILNYKIWMPAIDTAHAVRITIPTLSEVVVRTPFIPGLEFHIPAGTTITDVDGKKVSEVSITPIPISQPPFPLPAGVNVPTYFTLQPGAGYLSVKNSKGLDGGWLVYPNTFHQPAGTHFDFWDYDADKSGWWIYGQGKVSTDGSSIVPDAGVRIYELTGAMVAGSGSGPGSGGSHTFNGDPIDLGTGLFDYQKTDLMVSDVIPIELTRSYRPNDSASRAFGVGTSHPYDIFLVGDISPYTYQDLVLSDGARIHFTRTSPGTGYTDAVYQCTSTAGPFFGATIKYNGNGGIAWTLTKRDGTNYNFPDGSFATRGQQGALLSFTDRNGNLLAITRDSNSNITQITTPNGRWIQFTYDSSYRITQVQDNIGRTVQYSYDSGGRLATVIDSNGGTWTYSYDSSNNMTSIIDPRSVTILQNQYDMQNRVITQTLADGTSTYQFSYNPAACSSNCSGIWETDVTDPDGNVIKYYFNSAPLFPSGFVTEGTLSSVTRAAGTALAETTSYQYQSGTNLLTSVTDSLSRTSTFDYDSLGNIISKTNLQGTANAVTGNYSYDPTFNQLISMTDPLGHITSKVLDSHGNPISIADPNGNVTNVAYDGEGRVILVTDPAGESKSYTYDGADLASVTDELGRTVTLLHDDAGRLTSKVDASGQKTSYTYDPLNHVTQMIDPNGATISFSYDGAENLLTTSDANGHGNVFTYDNNNRLATRTDALSATESYSYDPNGNIAQYTDRRGKIAQFAYDAVNRETFEGFGVTSGPSYESTVTRNYDAGNRVTSVVDSVTGTISIGYDGLDNITSESSPQGTISYTYDAEKRRTGATVTGQTGISYSYDPDNRLVQLSQGLSTAAIAYDVVGRRTALTLPNSSVTRYTYDSASQVTGLAYEFASNIVGNLSYQYDLNGKRLQASGTFARTGLPSAQTTATYNADNQLTQWGAASLTYDANGNMTSDGTNSFVWNARNQLASMNSNSLVFEYDPFGRRVSKTVSGVTSSYLYENYNPIQELSGGSVTANLLSGGIDELFARTDSAGQASVLADHLGSTVALSDSSGGITTQYTYEPYGKTTIASGSSTNPYQYTGRELDPTGLYYYRARYYMPSVERFISEDPVGHQGGADQYSYVANSPVNYVDPTGLYCMLVSRQLEYTDTWVEHGHKSAWFYAKNVGQESGDNHDISGGYMAGVGANICLWRRTYVLEHWKQDVYMNRYICTSSYCGYTFSSYTYELEADAPIEVLDEPGHTDTTTTTLPWDPTGNEISDEENCLKYPPNWPANW